MVSLKFNELALQFKNLITLSSKAKLKAVLAWVLYIIRGYLKQSIVNFTGIWDRVAPLKLNMNGYQLDIIQVYASSGASNNNEIGVFYSHVDEAIKPVEI